MKTMKITLYKIITFLTMGSTLIACQVGNKPIASQIVTPSIEFSFTPSTTQTVNKETTKIVIPTIEINTAQVTSLPIEIEITQVKTPSLETKATPEGLVALPLFVNIDGFAYAACMAINLLMKSVEDTPKIEIICSELAPLYRSSVNPNKGLRVPEWFVKETNSIIHNKSLPLVIQRHPSASKNDILSDFDAGIFPIALVQAGCCFHAVVIVGYSNQGGFKYLDSLQQMGDHIPNEDDFFEDYGIKFQEAWMDTFELMKTK
jgi:hypothetical protein